MDSIHDIECSQALEIWGASIIEADKVYKSIRSKLFGEIDHKCYTICRERIRSEKIEFYMEISDDGDLDGVLDRMFDEEDQEHHQSCYREYDLCGSCEREQRNTDIAKHSEAMDELVLA